jgi:hypothetical protein
MRVMTLRTCRIFPTTAAQRIAAGSPKQPEPQPQEPDVDKFEAMLLEAREDWAAKRGRKGARREPVRAVQRRLLPHRA